MQKSSKPTVFRTGSRQLIIPIIRLVDYQGTAMAKDADDQADICEIIRSIIHGKTVGGRSVNL